MVMDSCRHVCRLISDVIAAVTLQGTEGSAEHGPASVGRRCSGLGPQSLPAPGPQMCQTLTPGLKCQRRASLPRDEPARRTSA